MMLSNLFFAIILGFCLTFSSSQVIRRGKCPSIRPLRNFNIHKMTGVWFLQYMYYYCPQADFKCSVYNMTLTKVDNEPAFHFTEEAYDDVNNALRSRTSYKIIDMKHPAKVISYSYGSCFNDTQTCDYVGVGKGYSYFIFYCCKPYEIPGFKYETLGIRTRTKKINNSLKKDIWRNLRDLKLSTKFLLPVSQDCAKDPLSAAE